MYKKSLRALLYLFFCFAFAGYAQKGTISLERSKLTSNEADTLEIAHNFFEEGNFLLALPHFKKLYDAHSDELFFKYKLGVCYLYKTDQTDVALELLKSVYDAMPEAADINFFLGRAYFINYKFDEAIEQFNKYAARKIPEQRKKETLHFIENCNNGKTFVANPVKAKIENIGRPINTSASEYVPVISADQSVMIFTYRGEKSIGGIQGEDGYFEDVYISEKIEDKWSEPRNIGENINGYGHDASIALSADGQKLFIYKNTNANKGDIYMSKLQGSDWSYPEKVSGDVNTSTAWEGSVSMSADEKTLYFSSERAGGLGGKDLYKSELQPDGTWGRAENLGPTINTVYDDDAPFFHPNGKTMYYSSQGHNSMGGYDIFTTDLREDKTWTIPENMGYPVNTTGDDIYFVLAANGTTGYYSSGKSGGFGQQDIYVLHIEPKKNPLVLVKGIVTLDDKPVEANILITESGSENEIAKIASNSVTGKYLHNLPAGKNYKITFSLADQENQSQTIEAANVDDYLEKEINAKFYTKEFVAANKPKTKLQLADTVKTETVTLETIADKTAEGLEYRVQIAAYKYPKNYNFQRLVKLGKVEKINLGDGVTRFVIGGIFKTLNDARAFNKRVVAAGQTDAFVTAIYLGKRVYLEDLVKKGIPFN